jgi:wyosine [tRNA(Phe)-imidazoG37] synthetase (radical SAM superfamily)
LIESMHAYGPVPSRRLGNSIGVSPIPAKVCSYSCVYCQLGRTSRLQVKRQSFFDRQAIMADLARVVDAAAEVDYVTFAGDGEPTLCADLGWLIEQCRRRWALPVAVITNGSLLFRDDVQQELMGAEVVLPTLDAVTPEGFRRINRPHRSLSSERVLDGLTAFRASYHGMLWIEVMLVRGLNDNEAEQRALREALDRLRPDQVYINLPTRPPAERWVTAPPARKIQGACAALGGAILMGRIEHGSFGTRPFGSAREAILQTGCRHPLRAEQAASIELEFGEPGTVSALLAEGILAEEVRGGRRYLVSTGFVRGRGRKRKRG